jgi:hypothetical protein
MEYRIYPELEGKDLIEELNAYADEVVQETYQEPLEESELVNLRARLTNLAIQKARLDEEEKLIKAELKERKKPVDSEYKEVITQVRTEQIEREGNLFVYIDRETKQVGYYSDRGILIRSRRATQEESQTTIQGAMRTLPTGTND